MYAHVLFKVLCVDMYRSTMVYKLIATGSAYEIMTSSSIQVV